MKFIANLEGKKDEAIRLLYVSGGGGSSSRSDQLSSTGLGKELKSESDCTIGQTDRHAGNIIGSLHVDQP